MIIVHKIRARGALYKALPSCSFERLGKLLIEFCIESMIDVAIACILRHVMQDWPKKLIAITIVAVNDLSARKTDKFAIDAICDGASLKTPPALLLPSARNT